MIAISASLLQIHASVPAAREFKPRVAYLVFTF